MSNTTITTMTTLDGHEIEVEVHGNVLEEAAPASWGYAGGEPGNDLVIEVTSVLSTESGVDIVGLLSRGEVARLEGMLFEDSYYWGEGRW